MLRDVIFAVGNKSAHWGSAVLRADQLSILAKEALENCNISVAVRADYSNFSGCDVVINKSFLIDYPYDKVENIKKNGNRIFLDFVDLSVKDPLCLMADTLIASSKVQYKKFLHKFPQIRTVYLPHQLDLRIPIVHPQSIDFSMVYVGDPKNARFKDELVNEKRMEVLNAAGAEDARWINRLSQFNAHYMLREKHGYDGDKPFIKGFIAAHCRSIIIVDKNDEEAIANLPSDYPFFCDVHDIHSVIKYVDIVASAFRGADWCYAQVIMSEVRELVSRPRLHKIIQGIFLGG